MAAAKKLSGAARRKANREATAAREVEAADGIDDGSSEFAKLGPPPLDSPETALAWVRRYQLTAMHIAASRPLTDRLRERLRFLKDFGATIGMTQNRSDLEQLAERLEGTLAGAKQQGAVHMEPVAPRPPTARGARRGPRPTEP